MKRIVYVPLCAALFAACVFSMSTLTFAQDLVADGGTQGAFGGTSVHVCPLGFAMAGAHVDQNIFLCLRVAAPGHDNEVATYLDTGTQGTVGGVQMHVCQAGWYMRGLHNGNNWLVCSRNIALSASFLDPGQGHDPTQGNWGGVSMHVCMSGPKRVVMTGIHDSSNQFSCANVQ
jgi:hypothetical protein